MLVVNQKMADKLSTAEGPHYLCSPEGKVFGHYIPFEKGTIYFEDLDPFVGEEEMLRQISDEGGVPIAELQAQLKSRKKK
jgi:hypothetical protein